MTTASILNKITNPTSTLKTNNIAKMAGIFSIPAIASASVDDIDNDNSLDYKENIDDVPESNGEINLWQFLRMYRIAEIPIMDWFIIYIFIFCLNSLYLHYDYKWVLLISIPMTILFNVLANKKFQVSGIIIIILVITTYYLVTSDF